MSVLVELKDVSVDRGFSRILRKVNMKVYAGENLGMVGPNGAGKTTLIRVMAQLIKPSRGEVRFFPGEPLLGLREVRGRVGVVLEQPFLYPELTAEENLRFFGELYEVRTLEQRIEEMLELVSLKSVSKQDLGTFSKGMRQRLSIARALLHRPQLLLMDEPFDGLDEYSGHLMTEILERFTQEGGTLVMITHHPGWVRQLCSRVLMVEEGRIVKEARVEDLSPKVWQAGYYAWVQGETDEFF